MAKRERKEDTQKLSEQVGDKVKNGGTDNVSGFKPYEGNFKQKLISTGSTLLDLAISGGKAEGGGIPAGILIEIFGSPSIGKTSMLCEIAGDVRRKKGEAVFYDPEARLSREFAQIFDLELKEDEVRHPNTPDDVFNDMYEWQVEDTSIVNGLFVDSTAALASDLEMENKKDEYSRRGKMFSRGFRQSARIIKENNYIMVCSNQIRDKMDSGGFGDKTDTPGGWAIKFYASLRLKAIKQQQHKLRREINYKGKKLNKVIGTAITVKVEKSSIWEPFHEAPVYILFDYGIDDIRANLEFTKKFTGSSIFIAGDTKLKNSMEDSITMVEEKELENQLKKQVIGIWHEMQQKFKKERKKKKRE